MTSTSRRLGVLAATAAAALALTACGSSNLSSGSSTEAAGGAEEGPVTIGVLVDQTAYLKSVDERVLAGIESAVDAVNANGGVLGGRDLQVVVEDMAADPQKQVQAFQKVASQDEPVLFLNGFSSAGNAATAPLATSEQTPMIVASVVPADDDEWVFSTITPMRYETGTRVEYVADQGITSVALLHDPTPYNKLQLDVIAGQLAEAGITVTGVEEHATDSVDLRPQISKLLSGQPGAIIKLSTGPTQIVAAKAMSDSGATVPLILGIESKANIDQASAAYSDVLVTAAPLQVFDSLDESAKTDAMTSFLEANPDSDDPTYLGRGWDAVQIAVRAIEEAGSTDGQAIRDALIAMDPYEGTSGSYDYTDEDHYGITVNPDYLARFSPAGAEIVFTPAK